ncbi:hypothetical protein PISL3812_03504 [Talaromyces islandicus]|uniref:Xylanolytic transcriptional activator regulatory domain-containing protein n=1 Tax=Talaromyces islandicus TaxID=28573 RepID=A0A0U1LSY1_TALIS|nr:hypothetical protein PISL3812_03504 [Talaromyces islandicus]
MTSGVFTSPLVSGLEMRPDMLEETCQNEDLFSLALTQLPDDATHPEFVDIDHFGLTSSLSNSNSTDSAHMYAGSRSPILVDTSSSSTRASSHFGSDEYQPLTKGVSVGVCKTSDSTSEIDSGLLKHEQHWHEAFAQFQPLQFLYDAINGHHPNERRRSPPEVDAIKPLLDSFMHLDGLAMRDGEIKARNLSWAVTSLLNPSPAQDLLPPRPSCDMLLDAYTNTFQSVLPILHIPSFAREYESFWSGSTARWVDIDEPFTCKLLLAMAVGSCMCLRLHNANDSDRLFCISLQEQANSWVTYGRQWLARRMVAGSRADLDMAQIVCLLALTRHTQQYATASTGASSFWGAHDLARIAIQMGLHREPRFYVPTLSVREAEMRRRLWVIMLELSMQQCFDEGLPAPVSPESYDSEPPSSVSEEDISYAFDSAGNNNASSASVVLLQLAQTQRLRLRILQLINAPGSSKTYNECHKLAAELNAACTSSPGTICSMSDSPPTEFQMKFLESFTRPFIVILHGPFADQASRNPTYYYSRRMRMEASAQILAFSSSFPLPHSPEPQRVTPGFKLTNQVGGSSSAVMGAITSNHQHSPSKPYCGTQTTRLNACASLRIYGSGHFALTQRQAATALSVDLISELRENAFPTLDNVPQRHLRDTLRETVGVFESRVRAFGGANSTHEFLLFAAADAYIDAMQRRFRPSDVNKAIVQAAGAALTVCCDAMERQRRRTHE